MSDAVVDRPTRSVATTGSLVAVGVLVLALVLGAEGSGGARGAALVVLLTVTALVTWVVLVLAAVRLRGRDRAVWALLAVTLSCWYASTIGWGVPFVDPDWRAPGVGLLAGGYLAAAAALMLAAGPRPRWRRPSARRRLVDAAVIACSFVLISLLTVFRAYLDTDLGAASPYVVAVPVASFALAGLAFVVSGHSERSDVRLELLSLAFAVIALSDLASVSLLAFDAGGPPVVAGGYAAASVLLSVAGLSALGLPGTFAPAVERIGRRAVTGFPDIVVVATVTTAMLVGVERWYEVVVVGLGAVPVVWRATTLSLRARQTREALEQQVVRRTADLEHLTQRYGRILDSVREGIVGLDDRARVTFVNAAAARMLGTGRVDFLGRDVCEMLCPDRGAAHRDACRLMAIAREGQVVEGWVSEVRRHDGGLLPVELDAAPKVWPGQESAQGMVIAFRDISERLVVEQLKRQFVSSVSHELRTPLASIRGVLELLADGDVGELSPTAHRLVANAERGADRLTRLVNDIIDVERLAAGDFDVTPSLHPVGTVVEDAVTSLRPLAAQYAVSVRVTDLDLVDVVCDADRVEQALVNLIGNAVKFTEPGGTVEVAARAEDDEVEITVRDHGRGIPADEVEHVFERFRQVRATDATEKGGTGLGLTITRSIVERHGGRIWVDSVEGVGTTFHFTLPRPVPAVPAVPAVAIGPAPGRA